MMDSRETHGDVTLTLVTYKGPVTHLRPRGAASTVPRYEGPGGLLLDGGQFALEPEVDRLARLTPILDGQAAARAAEEPLEIIPTAPRQGEVLSELLGARDDSRGEVSQEAKPLLLVELGVLGGRQSLDLVELGGDQTDLLHEEPLAQHGPDGSAAGTL